MRAYSMLVAPVIALACRAAPPAVSEDLGTWHVVTADDPRDRPDQTRLLRHMRQQRSDLRDLENALIDGRLEEARLYAFAIANDARDTSQAARTLRTAAMAVAGSTTLEGACRLAPAVAAACSGCHATRPPTPDASAPPADEPTTTARMARHRWATERAREALISGRIGPWRDALGVFAIAPQHRDREASRLERQARRAFDTAGSDSNDERALRYGEMLVTCARCHARSRR